MNVRKSDLQSTSGLRMNVTFVIVHEAPELDPSGTRHAAEYSRLQNHNSSSIHQQHVQSFLHGAIFQ